MVLNPSDELMRMRQIEWGDIVLPVMKLSNKINPRFAVNSYLEGDADELVKMGFESRQFAAELIFDNSIKDAFPKTYKEFILAVQDGVAKTLKHPIQGDILCFAKDYTDTVDSEHRSGVRASCTFVETLSSPESKLVDLKPSKMIAFDDKEIMNAAVLPEVDDSGSLLDLLNKINIMQNQLAGLKNKLSRQAMNIKNQIRNAGNKAISTFKLAGTAECTIAAMLVRKKLDSYLAPVKPAFKQYKTPNDMGLYALSKSLGTSVPNLVAINPSLSGQAVIKSGTIVFYN